MPIIEKKRADDIFASQMQVLVNPVNCIGIMGAGLAKKFREHFPQMMDDYIRACKGKDLRPGILQLWKNPSIAGKWVVNFPTKDHWRDSSKIEWIEQGLKYFVGNYENWGIKSIAIPALGSDLGGLLWIEVKALLIRYLEPLDIEVELYAPSKISKPEKAIEFLLEALRDKYNSKYEIYIARHIGPGACGWTNIKDAENLRIFIRSDINIDTEFLKNISIGASKKAGISVKIACISFELHPNASTEYDLFAKKQ